MAEFQTSAELLVSPESSSLRATREQIENELGDISVDVGADVNASAPNQLAESSNRRSRENAMSRQLLSGQSETLDTAAGYLETLVDLAEDRNLYLRELADNGVSGRGGSGGDGDGRRLPRPRRPGLGGLLGGGAVGLALLSQMATGSGETDTSGDSSPAPEPTPAESIITGTVTAASLITAPVGAAALISGSVAADDILGAPAAAASLIGDTVSASELVTSVGAGALISSPIALADYVTGTINLSEYLAGDGASQSESGSKGEDAYRQRNRVEEGPPTGYMRTQRAAGGATATAAEATRAGTAAASATGGVAAGLGAGAGLSAMQALAGNDIPLQELGKAGAVGTAGALAGQRVSQFVRGAGGAASGSSGLGFPLPSSILGQSGAIAAQNPGGIMDRILPDVGGGGRQRSNQRGEDGDRSNRAGERLTAQAASITVNPEYTVELGELEREVPRTLRDLKERIRQLESELNRGGVI